jgi:hypothetical protein
MEYSMPTYTFIDNETGSHFEDMMSIAEKEEYLQLNPHVSQTILHAPALADPTRLGRMKPEGGFRDLLKDIKKNNRKSKINTW